MTKAIFFDIDGTLISMKTRKISDALVDALYQLKENGIRLFIASGRPPVQLRLLDPKFTAFPWDGYVMMNGQYCLDENKECIFSLPIKQETLEVLVPWLKTCDFACAILEKDYEYDLHFNQSKYNYYKFLNKLDEMPKVHDPERMLTHTTYQICPYIPREQDPEFLKHAPGLKSARWSDAFADMIPENGGKPNGMKIMLERYGLEQKDSMAFGDGGNDITMLEYIGVAMGNGRDDVKAAADYVTADCEDEGIIKALEHFHLL